VSLVKPHHGTTLHTVGDFYSFYFPLYYD
jgi:hypothetical protein